jgi:glycosyltransferase involved in cell wall biosynthesis
MKKCPLVSIIIPTKNSSPFLPIAFYGISQQRKELYEVIVVDNESIDETLNIAKKYSARILQVKGKSPKVADQRNAGARAARGKYMLFLDHDMELPIGFLESFNKKIRDNLSVDAWYIPEKTYASNRYLSAIRTYENNCYIKTPISAARIIKSSVFRKTSGYDSRISSGPADWDFDMELRKNKRHFDITSMSLMHHEESLSFGAYVRKKKTYAVGLEIYRLKWYTYDHDIYERYVSRQFSAWYRLCGVFFEDGKLFYTLGHIHLYIGSLIVRMFILWYYFGGLSGILKNIWQRKF